MRIQDLTQVKAWTRLRCCADASEVTPTDRIGLCTPPVGNALFVGCAVGKATIEEVMPSLLMCYIPMVIILFIITFFPDIAMLLPNLIMK